MTDALSPYKSNLDWCIAINHLPKLFEGTNSFILVFIVYGMLTGLAVPFFWGVIVLASVQINNFFKG